MSAYDLSPELGTFDFVFCGDLLLHLKDPITPVENIRSVCTGSAVIVNVITKFRLYENRAHGRARRHRRASSGGPPTSRASCGSSVPPGSRASSRLTTFEVPFTGGGDWSGLRGAVRAYV